MTKPAHATKPESVEATFVRAARASTGKSGAVFGGLLGVTKANVSAWERGYHKPSFAQMRRISTLTGVPMPEIPGWNSGGRDEEAERVMALFGRLTPMGKKLATALLDAVEAARVGGEK